MKPTKELNDLRETASRIQQEVHGLRSQLPALAKDPVHNADAMQALQAEIAEAEARLKQARIAVKQKELELLEAE